MDEQLCPHRGHGRTALPPSGAWTNSFAPIGGMDEQLCPHRGHGRTALLPSGAGKGREPQQGTDGKQEQGQPWAESQNRGWKASRSRDSHRQVAKSKDGRQEQGQPWAESQFCWDGWQAGTGQQGQVLTHGTDSSKAIGASAYARDGR